MRKIIAGMFITLDGVVEAPEKWNPPYYDDELNQDVMPLLAAAGTHLYGRRSYELFRGVFTGPAAPPHAGLMTATPKVVVSTTLTNPDWGPTRVISSNITAAVTELKQQPGQDISVGASATLVRFLLAEHLLDELRLLVHPVVAGTGKRLFAETGSRVPLTLLESRPHRNGVMTLRYAPAEAAAKVPQYQAVADAIFEEPRLAEIYDELDPDRSDVDAYAAMAAEFGAESVLDVGCGTGTLA
jgi:dihydrofolate reductase